MMKKYDAAKKLRALADTVEQLPDGADVIHVYASKVRDETYIFISSYAEVPDGGHISEIVFENGRKFIENTALVNGFHVVWGTIETTEGTDEYS